MDTAPWYYVNADRQRHGPVPAATLRDLAAAGTVNAQTLVWRQGLPQWQALEQVADELGITLAPPVPAPPPPPTPPPAPRAEEATRPAAGVGSVRVTPDRPVVYARFLKRVAASVIDSFIVGVLTFVVQTPFALIGGFSLGALGNGADAGLLLVQAMIQLIGVAIGIAYFGYFYTAAQQASPGKLLVGIKVARPDGERISFARSVGRYFANWLNVFTLGLSYLLPLFTEKRQALHDLIGDTVVVDRWAFTEFPERQDDALGGCAVAVLVLWAVMLLGILGLTVFAFVAMGSGNWN